MLEDQAVLARAGLALVSVDQDVLGLVRLLGYKRPLHPGGKAGATAPAKIRRLHLADDPVGTLLDRRARRLVALQLKVLVNRGRALAKAAGDDLHHVGMGNEIRHDPVSSASLPVVHRPGTSPGSCPALRASDFRRSRSSPAWQAPSCMRRCTPPLPPRRCRPP